jgi:hypothetical protein
MSPHRPRKRTLTPLQHDILREVADPVEVYPAYVCILAGQRMPRSTAAQIVAASEEAVRGLARSGLIDFRRWTPERGESDQGVTVDDFCSALHQKVRRDPASGTWRSENDSTELILALTPEGAAYLRA